jgi:rhodanese-related sulfurtransferase
MNLFKIAILLFAMAAAPLQAAELPEKMQTTLGLYLTASAAHAMKQEQADSVLFIDVRTRAEIAWVGMPVDIDANIPFLRGNYAEWNEERGFFQMNPNPDFVATVETLTQERGLDKHSPVIVMCRSGVRGARAADALAQAGYTSVYNMIDGFEGGKADAGPDAGQRSVAGWKNSGLPWTTSIDKSKLR